MAVVFSPFVWRVLTDRGERSIEPLQFSCSGIKLTSHTFSQAARPSKEPYLVPGLSFLHALLVVSRKDVHERTPTEKEEIITTTKAALRLCLAKPPPADEVNGWGIVDPDPEPH